MKTYKSLGLECNAALRCSSEEHRRGEGFKPARACRVRSGARSSFFEQPSRPRDCRAGPSRIEHPAIRPPKLFRFSWQRPERPQQLSDGLLTGLQLRQGVAETVKDEERAGVVGGCHPIVEPIEKLLEFQRLRSCPASYAEVPGRPDAGGWSLPLRIDPPSHTTSMSVHPTWAKHPSSMDRPDLASPVTLASTVWQVPAES
jgi:hypothetical protein